MFDRIPVVGDSHGNACCFRLALDIADRLGIRLVIDGNHDSPGEGRRDDGGYRGWTAPVNDDLHLDPDLLVVPELWHVQRGTRLTLANQEICFVGSAISIDRSSTSPDSTSPRHG